MSSQLSRNGRFLALRGAVTLAFGIAALAWPQPSFPLLVRLFGLFALADGLVGGATAIGGRHASSRSRAILLEACTSLAVGLVLLVTNPTQLVFGYVIAGRFVLIGLLEVISSGYPPREAESEWVITLAGIASLLFGLTIVLAPGAAAGQRVTAIAAFMALLGLVLVAFASRVRDWRLAP